jgi:hypothetical protein
MVGMQQGAANHQEYCSESLATVFDVSSNLYGFCCARFWEETCFYKTLYAVRFV